MDLRFIILFVQSLDDCPTVFTLLCGGYFIASIPALITFARFLTVAVVRAVDVVVYHIALLIFNEV